MVRRVAARGVGNRCWRRHCRWLSAVVAVVPWCCFPPATFASSIVYSNGGSLWVMAGDGSGQRPIPNTAGLSEPSQANDGTILALDGGAVVRIDQFGHQLSAPVTTPVSPSSSGGGTFNGWSGLHGPYDPVISPDGTLFAYWGFGQTDRYDFGCGCFELGLENFVRYGDPHAFNEPASQGYGQGDAADPAWIGNSELMMTPIGPQLAKQVWYYVIGQAQNAEQEWFSDPGFNGDTATDMKEGAISPHGDKLAFVVDYVSASGQSSQRLIIYTTNGPPPAPPTQRCGFSGPAGATFSYPSFSPDGQSLAFVDKAGIEIVSLANLANCTTLVPHLAVPSGDHPAWGPANEQPLAGGTTTGTGSAGAGGSSPGTGTTGTGGPAPGTQPGAPQLLQPSLTGVATGHPRLLLGVASAVGGPDLNQLTVTLPAGLHLKGHRVTRGLRLVDPNGQSLPYTFSASRTQLLLKLTSPAPGLVLALAGPALVASPTLRHTAAHRGSATTVTVTVTVGSVGVGPTTLHAVLAL